ncbi:hypothetical protein F2Q70_00020974 [Brassica cretica]|uniref:Uncharacterized protein n=1 Tax=Brassica cretica TaxID=69181 RepID=A0A8S9GRL7_BRACR|nr:hypothetical protein F2Q70_00020974 [Brassica cretica]KAF2555710.1 hypothetical protein F2Q68_00014448 [Brassica cretica]
MSRAKDVLYDFAEIFLGKEGIRLVQSTKHTYWKLNGSMKVQQGRMCGTCVVEVLVEHGTMNTQAERKDIVNPLVSGVVMKAKLCSTIEIAFLVGQEVAGCIRVGSRKRSDLVGQHT